MTMPPEPENGLISRIWFGSDLDAVWVLFGSGSNWFCLVEIFESSTFVLSPKNFTLCSK